MTEDLRNVLYRFFEANMKMAHYLLYSEKYTYEDAYLEMCPNKSEKDQTLISLISFYYAIGVTSPISQSILDEVYEDYIKYATVISDDSKALTVFKVFEDLIEVEWLQRTKEILVGKIAFQQKFYSSEAGIYFAQKKNKGPIPDEQKRKWEALPNNTFSTKESLHEYLDEQALKFAIEVSVKKLANEIEVEQSRIGKRNEEERQDAKKSILESIKSKLKR